MRIITWNVNSVRVREERLLGVLERHGPDVVCLQELKTTDDAFPVDAVRAAGYEAATYGQKTYNGVAILAKRPPEDVRRGFNTGWDGDAEPEDEHARLISAVVHGVRIYSAYVPNGGEVGSEKYAYKLAWLDRVGKLLAAKHEPAEPLVFAGDLNITFDDQDVAFPEKWEGSVHTHPEMRDALQKLAGFGLVDVFRAHHPEGGVYSWWDYRQLGFPKGNGLRIDAILATEVLAKTSTAAEIDRDERKGKQPSDHAPVIVDFEWSDAGGTGG
ncbi:MAG: exodeoxyribonuclease III [Planctomycetota bacterium]